MGGCLESSTTASDEDILLDSSLPLYTTIFVNIMYMIAYKEDRADLLLLTYIVKKYIVGFFFLFRGCLEPARLISGGSYTPHRLGERLKYAVPGFAYGCFFLFGVDLIYNILWWMLDLIYSILRWMFDKIRG